MVSCTFIINDKISCLNYSTVVSSTLQTWMAENLRQAYGYIMI